MLHCRYGFIKTAAKIVKIGNREVESMVVEWAIRFVVSLFCGVQRGLLNSDKANFMYSLVYP
jgi:hypothetical protein